ncbi:MAG TPA: DUF4386 family protein, partial [Pyrinomonadaceae bacterium]|nr:DUF4386 family protein [Pyrinomonadaceae bacterium]
MSDSKRAGRVVGAMLLLQFVGLMVGFILITDVLRSSDFLTTAAGNATRIKAGIMVLIANDLLTIGVSIVAWPVLSKLSQPMAMWLIILGVIMFLLQVVDGVHIMSMLSLSEQYAEGGSPD